MGKEVKYVVRLTADERQTLEDLVASPRTARATAVRARLLLKADADGPAWNDEQLTDAFDVSLSTVHRLRQRLVEQGFTAALERQPPCRTKPRKLDGTQEARLIATACSAAPAGRQRWTMRLLADKLVELEVVEAICPETVRRTLKKTR